MHRNDAEDLEQEFTAAVLKAAPRYEPALGSPVQFLNGALNYAYKGKLRRIRRETERPSGVPLMDHDGFIVEGIGCFSHDPTESVALQNEVRRALDKLPVDLRLTAESLMTTSAQQTALKLGIDQGTVYRHAHRLREHLGPNLKTFWN